MINLGLDPSLKTVYAFIFCVFSFVFHMYTIALFVSNNFLFENFAIIDFKYRFYVYSRINKQSINTYLENICNLICQAKYNIGHIAFSSSVFKFRSKFRNEFEIELEIDLDLNFKLFFNDIVLSFDCSFYL